MRRRAVLAAPVLLIAPAYAAPVHAEEDQLTRVMRALSTVRTRHDLFTEQRSLPDVDVPLTSEGTLAWNAPATLEKHTTSPIDERIAVSGARLLYERKDRGFSRAFSLDDQPEMQAFVEAIRGTLAGDLDGLRRFYTVGFSPQAEGGWRLELVPLAARVKEVVQRIVLYGRGVEVTGVDTEGNGNTSRMQIRPAP